MVAQGDRGLIFPTTNEMEDADYSKQKGVADEANWNEFVLTAGGELVAPYIKRQGVKNADYMFKKEKVIIELKIIETEFSYSKQTILRMANIMEKYKIAKFNQKINNIYKEYFDVLRMPLKRIINKVNRQIKETKAELQLDGWRGITVCVNDGMRGVPPILPFSLLNDILAGASYTNTDALIYQTNHYIELPDNPYAVLLWAPSYSDAEKDDLPEFVNALGAKWRAFSETKIGPFEFREQRDNLDLSKASVVSGIYRNRRYIA